MIDQQLDVFPGHVSFVLAVLGLRATCERFVRTLEIERRDGGACPDGPLVDFALGVVSLTRTFNATLSAASPNVPEATPIERAALARSAGWLR